MTDTIIKRDFLKQHGEQLIDQGYTVVPIQPGKKAPGFDGWQKAKPSKPQVREWLTDGFKNAGVGIVTKFTIAIDIDCNDEAAALKFQAWCFEHIGPTLVRIGKAPKRLLLYRTVEPFRKKRSTVYKDEWGEKQLIEVLADGQQFVAFHIHPDTGKPYEWVTGQSPLDVRATDLTEVSGEQIQNLIQAFENHAKAEGWYLQKASRGFEGAQGKVDPNNPWIEDSQPIELTTDEIRMRLLLVPHADDHDTWVSIGMALHHQFDGDDEGFALWDEWSETADNYDRDALERKWKSFDIEGKGRAPLTARLILRLAREAVEATALELGVKIRDAFANARDLAEWEKARKLAAESEIDGLTRVQVAVIAKDRRDTITGIKSPLSEIKKAVAYKPKGNDDLPKWAQDWCYDHEQDRFFSLKRKISMSKQGFDANYNRMALTKKDILDGKGAPSMSASTLALDIFKIPTVDGTRYMPGRDGLFHETDGYFANAYPEHEIPDLPETDLPRDKRNVDRVKAHIAHLLEREKEQRMLLDWLSWVVQNPGRHANYAVLLQGVEGDGKSFFGEMMRAVMGVTNVQMANGDTIITSQFTDWAYGSCLCCVEEVRFASNRGVDKWQAINRIKPFIANNLIEVHPKGRTLFNCVNTQSYLLFSNFKDALPLDDNARRYLVLFSKWQRKDDIQAFKREAPRYYERLYNALIESPGALRQWLLNHEQDEDFNPMGDAPDTAARSTMVRKSKPEFMLALDDIINEDRNVCASRLLVDVTTLSDVIVAMGVEWPGPKALASMMERDGYESMGKTKVDGEYRVFYSKNPNAFQSTLAQSGEITDTTKIRAYLKTRAAALSEKSLADEDDDEI